MHRKLLLSLFSFSITSAAFAQQDTTNDLANLIAVDEKTPTYVTSTFKSTRVVNGHSIENPGKGILDFRIVHRFGRVGGGAGEFFGLDGATTMLNLDYGVTDRLAVGLSRSALQKEVEGYGKYKVLRQKTTGMPISLSYLGVVSIVTNAKPTYVTDVYAFSNRLYFLNQLIIARKFSKTISVQLSPTHIHYNYVDYAADPNDLFSLGTAVSVKVSKRIALNAEYFLQMPDHKLIGDYTNAFSVGCDIETGGHVFQLVFSNSQATIQRYFITQTTDRWFNGLHFGFNISRVFTVVKPKGMEGSRSKIY